jgi:P pilus assembly chaperone PapD
MKRFIWLAFLCIALAPGTSWAKGAEVLLSPTRVVLDNGEKFSTIIVKNAGDAPGDYRISLADMKMRDDGAVVPYSPGETPQ